MLDLPRLDILPDFTGVSHQSNGKRGGGETGEKELENAILFVCLDMSHLPTIGTLASRPGRDSICATGIRRPGVSGACFVVQLFLLFSSLSSGFVLLESLEFLFNSANKEIRI